MIDRKNPHAFSFRNTRREIPARFAIKDDDKTRSDFNVASSFGEGARRLYSLKKAKIKKKACDAKINGFLFLNILFLSLIHI